MLRRSVKPFSLCGSECPDKSGVYEYCKGYHSTVFSMLWWSSSWVVWVVCLYLWLCLKSWVMWGSSTPGCRQRLDNVCPRVPCVQIINYFYCSTFFARFLHICIYAFSLLDVSECIKTFCIAIQTLCFLMNKPWLGSAVFVCIWISEHLSPRSVGCYWWAWLVLIEVTLHGWLVFGLQ